MQFIQAGPVRRRDGTYAEWDIPPETLRAARPKLDGVAVFVDHAGWGDYPSVRDMAGVTFGPAWDADNQAIEGGLRLYSHADWLRSLLDELIADREQGREVPDVGLSLVFYGQHEERDGRRRTTRIDYVESCDIVFGPAAEGRLKAILSKAGAERSPERSRTQIKGGERPPCGDERSANGGERTMDDPKIQPATNLAPADRPDTDDSLARVLGEVNKLTQIIADDERERQETIVAALGQQVGHLTQALRTREEKNAVQGMGRAPNDRLLSYLSGRDELERFGQVVDWLFGVKGATLPDPQYRRADAIYWALTGDYEFRGTFDKARVQLASASTVSLADMAVNAMNKVLLQQFSDLGFWRWYERIVAVTPNDGSVQAMQWITYGGVGNLPSVAEGGAYTELAVGDVKESSSFTKFGGYVGITREMIKNSDIVRIQAVPRALATAAVRTRSAAVAGIFTSNSGVGPTLAQDGVALFNAGHSNLGTTAFAQAEWRVVRAAIFKHVEVQSGKRLGMYPRFAIFPPDLYDAALAVFGYGDGYPTSYTPEAQDRGLGDPRPVPLVCPDFTDATDWAAIVDPQVYPVICMSYSQLPGGGSHPIPELFSVVNETAGLMFTNDTLPIKVRDEFAVGVNGPRGIYKENVAG